MTGKQRRFVAELAKGKTQKAAAIAAGYPARTAEVMGSKLVRNGKIQAALDAINAKSDAAVEVSATRIKAELWSVAGKAQTAEQYGAATNALGKLLDKCAPDKADPDAKLVIEIRRS